MDNATHTLLGLSLAKAGFERITPLATAALVISSNLPDIDFVFGLRGGTFEALKQHRGITHSLAGIAVLSAALALVLTLIDRGIRLRSSTFNRPARPISLFWVSCVGMLGHIFMDFTNSYGVRPLLPFSDRWFYGDLIFVVDPWIWLILGSAAVWLTATDSLRAALWLAAGLAAALIVSLAMRGPALGADPVPLLPRLFWLAALTVIVAGSVARWGRIGPKLARWSLAVLCLYYSSMWMLHQSALEKALKTAPRVDLGAFAVIPAPGNILSWRALGAGPETAVSRQVSLLPDDAADWKAMEALDPVFINAIRRSDRGRTFLDFARFWAASVEEMEGGYGGYIVTVRDLRFSLRMTVQLDRQLDVISAEARWF